MIHRWGFRPNESFSSWKISSTFRIGIFELDGLSGILLNDVFVFKWEGNEEDDENEDEEEEDVPS